MTEVSYSQNFNYGFSSHKSDILSHLSQWQYWWWFWFSFLWTFYYFFSIKVSTKKTHNLNMTINTSFRGRGKWGDFLIALIPVTWCCNILINSNFILRMIEWQHESSLFTIRVQGKQWYWVYKYDPNTYINMLSIPKNIGHNKWLILNGLDSFQEDTYYQSVHLVTQLEFKEVYLTELSGKDKTKDSLFKKSLTNEPVVFSDTWLGRKAVKQSENTKLNNNVVVSADSYPILQTKVRNYSGYPNKLLTIMNGEKLRVPYYKDLTNTEISADSNYLRFNLTQWEGSPVLEKLFSLRHTKINKLIDLVDFKPTIQGIAGGLTLNSKEKKLLLTNMEGIDSVGFSYEKNKLSVNNLQFLESPEYIGVLKKRTVKLANSKNLIGVNRDYNYFYDYIFVDDDYDCKNNTRVSLTTQPFRIVKGVLNNSVLEALKTEKGLTTLLFLNTKFNVTGEGLSKKLPITENYWGFRQERKKKTTPQILSQCSQATYDSRTLLKKGLRETQSQFIANVAGIDKLSSNLPSLENGYDKNFVDKIGKYTSNDRVVKDCRDINYLLALKRNRHQSELIPTNLAKRLLGVKRTLVLPAHINLTVITNSYDVVHSWFIPALGLKMDCVPGRSTHHSLYIDNVGFYYGQCAEICGRYHHHMPIKICALPFNHFVVWWNTKGLSRLLRYEELESKKNKKNINKRVLVFKNSC